MPGIRELKKLLVRGALVSVEDSAKQVNLRGQTVYVKSEALAPCKGGVRCAEGRKCNGYAVFVSVDDPAVSVGGAGWRKGAYKVCLTHLSDTEGNPLVSGATKTHRVEEFQDEIVETPRQVVRKFAKGADASEPVTWERLAAVAVAAELNVDGALNELIQLSRRLKAYESKLSTKLIEAQERLIQIQRDTLKDLGSGQAGQVGDFSELTHEAELVLDDGSTERNIPFV